MSARLCSKNCRLLKSCRSPARRLTRQYCLRLGRTNRPIRLWRQAGQCDCAAGPPTFCEISARQHLAVRLHHNRIDECCPNSGRRINQAGCAIKPGNAVAGLPAKPGVEKSPAIKTCHPPGSRGNRPLHPRCSSSLQSKAVSSVPSGFSLARLLRATGTPPLGESVVNSPPIRIFPSG